METMILVAGLAVAGLAGIAAAFYFSMRPGGSRDHTGRADVDRVPAGRSRTSQQSSGRPDRTADPARSARSVRPAGPGSGRAADRTGPSTVLDFTGPQQILDDEEPLATGRRARHGGRRDNTPDEPEPAPARRVAGRRSREAEPDDVDAAPRSRRRVGWRKGSDVDEELWPTEAFGGVSDEQFWDDLASDKPLATTARTAQADTAARRPPRRAGPLPDLHAGHNRDRGDGRRTGPAEGANTNPQPRLGPDDRTAIQPVQVAAPQPPRAPVPTQPYPTATSPGATQPVRAAEPRGRARANHSADEDPLTSPAYSLRPKGRVDGRSYSSSRQTGDLNRDQYDATVAQETQAFSLADTQAAGGGYPDGVPPFRQFDRPGRPDPLRPDPLRSDLLRPGSAYGGTVPNPAYTYPQQPYGVPAQSMNTPPYGYGSPAGSRTQPTPAGDPRQANGGWTPGQGGRHGASHEGRSPRPASPPVNGYRSPYDPQGYDRRLSTC
jgi:hypothetical protein